MNVDKLKRLQEEARYVAEQIRPVEEVDGEVWVAADGLAGELEQMYVDALLEDPLEQAIHVKSHE